MARNLRCVRSVRRFDLVSEATVQEPGESLPESSPQRRATERRADFRDVSPLRICFGNPSGNGEWPRVLAVTSKNEVSAEFKVLQRPGERTKVAGWVRLTSEHARAVVLP